MQRLNFPSGRCRKNCCRGLLIEDRSWLNPLAQAQAQTLHGREECFYGLQTPGMNLDDCGMHQQLLACRKLQLARPAAVA